MYRVTYFFEQDQAQYSYTESNTEWTNDWIEGDWSLPFPNEKGNSLAFGLDECLAQSDLGPSLMYEHGDIVRIKIEKL